MVSNGFEIGAAFGVVSGLVVVALLAPALALALAWLALLALFAEFAALVTVHAASLRVESMCGRPRVGRKVDRRADGKLIAARWWLRVGSLARGLLACLSGWLERLGCGAPWQHII